MHQEYQQLKHDKMKYYCANEGNRKEKDTHEKGDNLINKVRKILGLSLQG